MAGADDRVPPQNIEAEQSVLGSMLIERDAIVRVVDILQPESFYREVHKKIYEAIASLFEQSEAVDVVTLAEELRRRGHLDVVGGVSYLTSLANMVPTTANIEHYSRIVEEKAVLRRVIAVSSEIARQAFEYQRDAEEVLDRAETLIFGIVQSRRLRGYVPLRRILDDAWARLESLYSNQGHITGLPTGFGELDQLTSGLHASDLIILASRPSQGKTALSLNVACNVALKLKAGVGFFSLEMAQEQLALRMLCAEARVDSRKVRGGTLTDDEWSRLTRAVARLSEAPILVDDTPNINVMDLRAKARRMKTEHDINLLVVDYLQLIQTRGRFENRQQEISEISRSLKALSRELQVPILALSQLSRAVEQRQDKKPVLSDLRESGSLEQDADLVAFIYPNPDNSPEAKVVDLIIAKHRNGPIGSVKLSFLKDIGVFGSLDKRFQNVH